ncbi:hypothetical protein YSY22_35510 [Brevibacillus formosus]
MASIERTAYPRFKRNPTSKELHEVYTPTSRNAVRSFSSPWISPGYEPTGHDEVFSTPWVLPTSKRYTAYHS